MISALFHTPSIRVGAYEFFERLRRLSSRTDRLVSLYARSNGNTTIVLTLVIDTPERLEALQTVIARAAGFQSLTRELPACHIFEREIFESQAALPHGHPWLKPVRFSGEHQGKTATYPFYRVEGKEVHEVGVGPIHAGVIEPGHFRFHCLGEAVQHLEIQLGFQHRGVEELLLARPPWSLAPLVETISGDSSVAHAWAYASALEGLCGMEATPEVLYGRGIALELERVAMHLAGLSGLATDIGFLQGAASYGRLRTSAINTSLLLCGSRFGRGWLRPGGTRACMSAETAAQARSNLALLERDIALINTHFRAARSVRHRLEGVGTLTAAQVAELGFVGMVARSSGVPLDARSHTRASAPYGELRPELCVEAGGDCWARALLRIREIDVSIRWLAAALDACPLLEPSCREPAPLRPEQLSVALCEGWRGEVVHCLETDANGALQHYRVQDPSLRNWFAVALAVRDNGISDFPICNKSFDLSYCGNDL
jgi:Ni,Fe-hydrogenase III large subunit